MGSLTMADLIDILVVAFLVYGSIVLLKKTRSVFVVIGIAILALVYIFARVFELTLTAAIFKSFFGVFLIALVIIFQAELRRFFELVALWGSASWRSGRMRWRKNEAAQAKPDYLENLVHVTERLAQQKIGMLVVITGKESLERHLQGGFDLRGKVSEPLLLSIFDPSSPGHDGAVIIEGDEVAKFGVHLPLSKDFSQIQRYGTRHSAALGIAEVSDGLSIIVSEERGRIATACDGRLRVIEDIGQLEAEIENFLEKRELLKPTKTWQIWLTEDINNKILALFIAILAWLLFVWPLR